ncbi:MAG: TolC family protein [Bacteroidetes bacterium]|nr:TolC family protein [Bacteroidota bacterium]
MTPTLFQNRNIDVNLNRQIHSSREKLKYFQMRTILKFFFSSIFCLSILSLQAQEPLVLSLDSAVNYAIEHNRTLINSRFAIDKSSQKIKETIAMGLPQVDASVDYTNFLGAEASLTLGPGAPPVTIEFNPTSNFKLSASQLLFSGNFIVGVQLSKLAKKITKESYNKDVLDIKEQTIQAYYMVLVSKKILDILQENKKDAQTIYNKTQNMANVGLIEQTDAKKLSVMVTGVNNAYKAAERRLELSYNLLRLQLGLEPNQVIKLTSTLSDIEKKNIVQSSVVDSFNIENNADYKIVSMQGDIVAKQIIMQKTNYLPSLVAFYSYTEKIKKPVFDMSPKNILGVTLSIPIFSSGVRHAKLSQAKIDYKTSQNTKELVSQQLTLAEVQSKYNYNNYLEQYENQKSNVVIAKEVLDQIKLKYRQGLVSSLEMTSANSDYLKAESDKISTLLELLNAELALKKINNNL